MKEQLVYDQYIQPKCEHRSMKPQCTFLRNHVARPHFSDSWVDSNTRKQRISTDHTMKSYTKFASVNHPFIKLIQSIQLKRSPSENLSNQFNHVTRNGFDRHLPSSSAAGMYGHGWLNFWRNQLTYFRCQNDLYHQFSVAYSSWSFCWTSYIVAKNRFRRSFPTRIFQRNFSLLLSVPLTQWSLISRKKTLRKWFAISIQLNDLHKQFWISWQTNGFKPILHH